MNEKVFVDNISLDPCDQLTRLAYADWLEENGRTTESDLVRNIPLPAAQPATTINHFTDLLGKTLIKVEQVDYRDIIFTLENGQKYRLYHEQECCESVTIEDVCGNLDDLVGQPILMAEEVIRQGRHTTRADQGCTWTFYKFATIKGYVTIRWCGWSDSGYYSEKVHFGPWEPYLED